MQLADVTTNIIDTLATDTGHAFGDAEAPGGHLENADYPFGIVYRVDGAHEEFAVSLAGVAYGERVAWQIKCVGLSRLQAESLRDRAVSTMLDPAVSFNSATTIMSDVRISGDVNQSEKGVHNSDVTVSMLATPA